MIGFVKSVFKGASESIIGSTISRELGEFGKKQVEKIIEKETAEERDYKQVFVTIFLKLPSEYQKILGERLEEARSFPGKEDWVIKQIGSLLKTFDNRQRKVILKQFAHMTHVSGLSDDELRQEWKRPEKSEFLMAVEMLSEEAKLPNFVRNTGQIIKATYGEGKKFAKSIAVKTIAEIKKADSKLAPFAMEVHQANQNYQKKKGYKI